MSGEAPDAAEITFGATTFRIGKLLPREAKNVFMAHVRPLLRGALSANVSGEEDKWQLILAAFTDAPQEHYDAIVAALYSRITYKHATDPQYSLLADDDENAFKSLTAAHMLILEGRAFYVNFHESFSVVLSEWRVLQQHFPSLRGRTQTTSSGTSSSPDGSGSSPGT